jgi:uridine kinase
LKQRLLITVSGGSGAGKSRFAEALQASLSVSASIFCEDWYYFPQGQADQWNDPDFNFDHPAAKDFDLLRADIRRALAGLIVSAPRYDFNTHRRLPEIRSIEPADIIILEGLHSLGASGITEFTDLGVYIAASTESRLSRRIARDRETRGLNVEQNRELFWAVVDPMHNKHVEPQRSIADLVIDNSTNNPERLLYDAATVAERTVAQLFSARRNA